MFWANFLHIYQPPIQKPAMVEKIVKESYRPLLTALLQNPTAKATININAVLTEMLHNQGYDDVIALLRELSERGQVELTSSAKYHPFLPILPDAEVIRQIKLNDETNRHFFGESYQPKGFFIPEMAYTKEVGQLVHSLGYQWTILDDTSLPADQDNTKLYHTPEGLLVFFRDLKASLAIIEAEDSQTLIHEQFSDITNRYCITAMDGEMFGHHKPNHITLLMELYGTPAITSTTVSELLNHFTEKIEIEPKASSWDDVDRRRPVPFTRWRDSGNAVHQLQSQLFDLAIKTVNTEVEQHGEQVPARHLLDAGLHSCQLWWASATPWWSLEMIEQGAHQLLMAVNTCKSASIETKRQAQILYYQIITTGFEWQRTGHVDERGKQ